MTIVEEGVQDFNDAISPLPKESQFRPPRSYHHLVKHCKTGYTCMIRPACIKECFTYFTDTTGKAAADTWNLIAHDFPHATGFLVKTVFQNQVEGEIR